MNKLVIPQLAQKLLVLGDRQLGESSVPGELLSLAADAGTKLSNGSISSVVGASVGVSIDLYNETSDGDEDGIVGAASRQTSSAALTTDWRPQIDFLPGSAWIKYSLFAAVNASASSQVGMAGGNISGDRSVRLLCYKRHDGDRSIVPTVLEDLDGLASPLSANDVLGLSLQEATALKIRGNLTARLSLNWSDIFSTSLNELSDLIPDGDAGALLINFSSAATVSFTATLDDDFTLCFVREKASGDRAIKVAVRKSIRHDQRFLATAGVRVEFADPSAVRGLVAGVLAGLLDAPATALAAIERATSLDSVPEEYRSWVTALAERFGIADADPLKPLRDKLRELDSRLTERIDRIARTKLTLGLRYEYLRISSEASLLEASLSESALTALHACLLAFDFAKVLNYAGPGLSLDFFLHQKTVDRVRAFGFSLGIGTWLTIGSKQARRDRFISRRYVSPGRERVTHAYLGSTHYTANANSWSTDYGATLKADMEVAREARHATANDFDYGLHLWWEEAKLKPATRLARIVDDAVLWGVVKPEAAAGLFERLGRELGGIEDCKIRLSVLLDDDGLRHVLPLLASASDADFGRHAARALPWQSRHSVRSTCAHRETVYSDFFAAYAQAPDRSGRALKQLIAVSLRGQAAGLAGQEAKGETPWTLYQALLRSDAGDGRFWRRWQQLRTGASQLFERLRVGGDWQAVDEDFALMSHSFEQAYLIRAVASLIAQQLPPLLREAKACATTLTVSYASAGGEKLIVVGGKAGFSTSGEDS